MEELRVSVVALKARVEKLIQQYEHVSSARIKCEAQLEASQKELREKDERIASLERQLEARQVAEAVTGQNDQQGEVKKRINELVREVDKCIALLNK